MRMLTLLLAVAAAAPALAADITFFEQDSFRGRSFNANQAISNFANVGYNDRASSAVVRGGTWQLCSEAYFRGRCVTVSPGRYPTLSAMGLDNAISSARDLDWLGGGSGGAPGGGSGRGRVELFHGEDFVGPSIAANGPLRNFVDVDFNDRAQSMIVHAGNWELCADADFRGRCETYGPGRYANLGALGQRASSIRPAPAGGGGGWGGGGLGGGGDGWGSGSRAILYEQPDMSGRSITLDREVAPNLGTTGFNDRASSLRIEGGYWIFCTDADFQGECRTFGPGDYPTLPWGINNRISSGRRIDSNYPYGQNPAWQRR